MTVVEIPNPPVRRASTRRWSMPVVHKARLLYQGEWTIGEICELIAKEYGARPSGHTVRRWVIPGHAEHRNRSSAAARARRLANRPAVVPQPAAPTKQPELDDAAFLALRLEDELTFSAMTKVIARFYGITLTVGQVRCRLDRLGVPRDQNKARRVAGNPGRFPQRTAA